jgi:hypothetical protein
VPAIAVALVAAALAVRLVDLQSQPGGLYPDEGAEALDAYRLLHVPGFHPVFFHDDGGREALYAYVVAVAFRIAGASVLVLRSVSVAIGVLAVAALYPALRRFGPAVTLAGMAWAAGALWLICISRDGMRNVLVPLFGALLLWALVRWADRPARGAALLAGAIAGAGLWTYQPLKLAPILVVLWLLWLRHANHERYLRMRSGLGWFALAYAIAGAPMLLTAVMDPVNYFGRAAGVSPLNPANSGIGFVDHTLRTLGMFVFAGDPNPRHDVGSLPLLGWPLFGLACLGAWSAWTRRHDPGYALVLLGVPVFLLPPLLGIDGGVPHFLRSLGLAPFLAALVGMGAALLIDLSRRRPGPWPRVLAVASLAVLLAVVGAGSWIAYFSRPQSARYQAFAYDVVALANAAGPRDAVVVDDYNRIDVEFLDAGRPTRIFQHGVPLTDPGRYAQVLALSRQDLEVALGPAVAARARVVSTTPAGRPAVWSVAP